MTQPNQNRAKPHLKNTMAGPRAAAALLLCATALPSTLGAVSRIPITVNRGRSNTTTGLGSTGHGTVTDTHTHLCLPSWNDGMPACPPSRTPATAPHRGWMGGCLHVTCVDRCFGLRCDAIFECVAVWHSALCCVFGCPRRVAVCDSVVQVMHKQRVHSHAATHTFLQPASVPPHARAPDQVKISNFENAQVGGATGPLLLRAPPHECARPTTTWPLPT
jgi:hypothetical protein